MLIDLELLPEPADRIGDGQIVEKESIRNPIHVLEPMRLQTAQLWLG